MMFKKEIVMYDIFISYRRNGGSTIAQRVFDHLDSCGLNPFLDIVTMESGRFDEQLRTRIKNATNFILILSKGALDRCVQDKEDWITYEIALAIESNLRIIVVREEGFVFPARLPDEINSIRNYQAIIINESNLSSKFKEIDKSIIKKESYSSSSKPEIFKKFVFSGDYITTYEDLDNGRRVLCTAPATLKQFFTHVSGTTTFNGTKSWKIRAKIYKKKRVAGIYYANGLLDDGFGTLFIEVKNQHTLEGFWTGYDSANNQISSGKYVFKKVFSNIAFLPLTEQDWSEVYEIANAQLGRDYISIDTLRLCQDKDSSLKCFVAKDKKTKSVLAFSIIDTIDYNQLMEITKNRKIVELMFCNQIGYIKSVAVSPKFKGHGISYKLINYCIEYFKKKGITKLVSTAWKHAGIINIKSLLEKQGFSIKTEIPDYWYEDSIKNKFDCPQCGNPCHCTSVIYIKR